MGSFGRTCVREGSVPDRSDGVNPGAGRLLGSPHEVQAVTLGTPGLVESGISVRVTARLGLLRRSDASQVSVVAELVGIQRSNEVEESVLHRLKAIASSVW
jgi:hypothetical protein